MTGESETPEAEAIGLHLTIGPPGADRFDHADGGAEAIVQPARLTVLTGHPAMSELGAAIEYLMTGHPSTPLPSGGPPIVIEARGPAGEAYLELSPTAAEALGLALIRHAARVES